METSQPNKDRIKQYGYLTFGQRDGQGLRGDFVFKLAVDGSGLLGQGMDVLYLDLPPCYRRHYVLRKQGTTCGALRPFAFTLLARKPAKGQDQGPKGRGGGHGGKWMETLKLWHVGLCVDAVRGGAFLEPRPNPIAAEHAHHTGARCSRPTMDLICNPTPLPYAEGRGSSPKHRAPSPPPPPPRALNTDYQTYRMLCNLHTSHPWATGGTEFVGQTTALCLASRLLQKLSLLLRP
ncbi:hypothetical protein EDB80DRAFT_43917 [Ilyonectria destructans]|nr:hypothetical protein EDB80DRAFT_43917 [Ilyonectria destructans]